MQVIYVFFRIRLFVQSLTFIGIDYSLSLSLSPSLSLSLSFWYQPTQFGIILKLQILPYPLLTATNHGSGIPKSPRDNCAFILEHNPKKGSAQAQDQRESKLPHNLLCFSYYCTHTQDLYYFLCLSSYCTSTDL